MAINLATLKTELSKAAYVGKSDGEVADMLNAIDPTILIDRQTITGNEFLNAVVPAEYAALVDPEAKAWVRALFTKDEIDIRSPAIRTIVASLFPVGSTTRANLAALQKRPGSVAEQLFGIGTVVSHVDVAEARK